MRARSLMLAAVLLLVGACVLEPEIDCDDSEWEPGMTCAGVIAAAQSALPTDAWVTSLSAVQGMHCPDARASCPFTSLVVAVYADTAGGDRLYVNVALLDDGTLLAQPPGRVEPDP